MGGLIRQLRQRVEWHARRTLIGAVGLVCVLIGGGFAVAAVWMAIAAHMGAIGAALILGAVFFGAGLVVLSLGAAPRRAPPPIRPDAGLSGRQPRGLYRPSGLHPHLLEAFLLGLSVYLETANRRR